MMLKKFLSVAIVGVFALSGCSQTKAEVKVPVAVKAVETKATTVLEKVVEKTVPSTGAGAGYIPFSELMK